MMSSEQALRDKYQLYPGVYRQSDTFHDVTCGYDALLAKAREVFNHDDRQENRLEDHLGMFAKTLSNADIDHIMSHYGDDSHTKTDLKTAINFIERIITPEIDAALKQYFRSNYAVLWYNWAVVEGPDTPKTTANKWHCDAGPTVHLKTITYFDNTDDHGSSTSVGDVISTQRLKDIGYLLNDIRYRQIDISDLTSFYKVDLKTEAMNFSAGDTVMFNPNQRMHQIILPKEGMKRRCLTLCYIPSTLPWQELLEHGFSPLQGGRSFEHAAKEILAIDQRLGKTEKQENTLSVQLDATINEDEVIDLDTKGTINSAYSLVHHLQTIFENKDYAQRLYDNITGNGRTNVNFTIDELMVKLKQSFQKDLNWGGIFNPEDLKNLEDLIQFEKRYYHSYSRYNKGGKPDPDAIMWPNPAHPKYPRSRFDTKPYVKTQKIMDMSTPVASAGSCFAFEISRAMQEQKFNYLIEERPDNLSDGVVVDGYTAGDKYAKFSANYGILFNTPSLLQLAQKAFGLRHFEKYCCRLDNGVYMDPYRENVFFSNKRAYMRDYPKHIEAIKRVLTKVKVMIFTAGLNECWQLDDGTVLSRNPRSGFYHMLKHRVLTVQENVDSLKGFIEIVRMFNPDFKLVISISPIPLLATGRAETHNILDANIHSKSVLKVAIDQVVSECDNVYYLPSYELVKECSRDPWEADHRHVTRETVGRVVGMFKDIFVKDE